MPAGGGITIFFRIVERLDGILQDSWEVEQRYFSG
jgi:hypothetical protein